MKCHGENSIRLFLFFSLFHLFFSFWNRETNVNLIMMQSWRRGKRSADFIYKDIVRKGRTAFTCIISFTENMLTKILRFERIIEGFKNPKYNQGSLV